MGNFLKYMYLSKSGIRYFPLVILFYSCKCFNEGPQFRCVAEAGRENLAPILPAEKSNHSLVGSKGTGYIMQLPKPEGVAGFKWVF